MSGECFNLPRPRYSFGFARHPQESESDPGKECDERDWVDVLLGQGSSRSVLKLELLAEADATDQMESDVRCRLVFKSHPGRERTLGSDPSLGGRSTLAIEAKATVFVARPQRQGQGSVKCIDELGSRAGWVACRSSDI